MSVTSYSLGKAPCDPLQGYVSTGLGVVFDAPAQLSFNGSGLIGTLHSDLLDGSTAYTVLLVDDSDNILFEDAAGEPQSGTLQFGSPFEGGFTWPRESNAVLQVCYVDK
jgi:hypothetical protein